MYNVDLRKKRCFLPGKLYEEKKNGFTCFKTYVNYLHRSVLSCNCITSYVAQIQHFRESKISKDQNWSSPSGKFVLQKVYLFKHVSELLLPISFINLHHFYVVIFYGVFLRCLFLCVFVCGFDAVLLLFLFFSLLFSFLAKISLNSKDTAVTLLN